VFIRTWQIISGHVRSCPDNVLLLDVNSNSAIVEFSFVHIQNRSIQRAYQNSEQLNERVSQAVDTRKEVDLRIGKDSNILLYA